MKLSPAAQDLGPSSDFSNRTAAEAGGWNPSTATVRHAKSISIGPA